MFQRFQRVEGARGRSYEGSGIGLALVQELIKLHGGSIAVESTLGKGTTFTVSIPEGQRHLACRSRQGAARGDRADDDDARRNLRRGSAGLAASRTADGTTRPPRSGKRVLLATTISTCASTRAVFSRSSTTSKQSRMESRRSKPSARIPGLDLVRRDDAEARRFGLIQSLRADAGCSTSR
jgi:hypothetical protein